MRRFCILPRAYSSEQAEDCKRHRHLSHTELCDQLRDGALLWLGLHPTKPRMVQFVQRLWRRSSPAISNKEIEANAGMHSKAESFFAREKVSYWPHRWKTLRHVFYDRRGELCCYATFPFPYPQSGAYPRRVASCKAETSPKQHLRPVRVCLKPKNEAVNSTVSAWLRDAIKPTAGDTWEEWLTVKKRLDRQLETAWPDLIDYISAGSGSTKLPRGSSPLQLSHSLLVAILREY